MLFTGGVEFVLHTSGCFFLPQNKFMNINILHTSFPSTQHLCLFYLFISLNMFIKKKNNP